MARLTVKQGEIGLWGIMLAVMLLLLLMGADAPTSEDTLQWASVECGQGNIDACQLERNLLTKR